MPKPVKYHWYTDLAAWPFYLFAIGAWAFACTIWWPILRDLWTGD